MHKKSQTECQNCLQSWQCILPTFCQAFVCLDFLIQLYVPFSSHILVLVLPLALRVKHMPRYLTCCNRFSITPILKSVLLALTTYFSFSSTVRSELVATYAEFDFWYCTVSSSWRACSIFAFSIRRSLKPFKQFSRMDIASSRVIFRGFFFGPVNNWKHWGKQYLRL